MFGPIRGEWIIGYDDEIDWNGWWGPEPPYHGPVFVLTNHPRPLLVMKGGTRDRARDSHGLPRHALTGFVASRIVSIATLPSAVVRW